MTFADLETIVNNINGLYNLKGYLTTNVFIPKQDIDPAVGKVEIAVAEGQMGNLKVEGTKWFSADYVKRFFHLKKNELLNFKVLQRDILRLNQNSDLEVKTLVSAGEEPQESDVTLTVKDKFPWHIGTSVDNQGTRLTGKVRTSVYGRSSNVTGNGDTLFVNNLLTTNTIGESFSYETPIGTHGAKAGFDYTYFWMKLSKEYAILDITGITNIYSPRVTLEMALTENFTANIVAALTIKSSKKFYDGPVGSNDQLTILNIGYDITNIDSLLGGGQTVFSPKFDFSIGDFLGSYNRKNSKAARAGTGGNFFKYEHYISRYQRMPFDSYITARSQFQAASMSLPSSEQIQIGGANSVRGYPEGDFLADTGATLSLDWVFPMYLIPKDFKAGGSDTPLRHMFEPAIFMDLGGGRVLSTPYAEQKYKFLMGLGGGIRVRLFNKFYLKLDWAQAVGQKPASGQGPSTFYFTFQGES